MIANARLIRSVLPAALFLALCISCAEQEGEDLSKAKETTTPKRVFGNAQVFRGFAIHGHEVRTFRPCDSDEALWAIDESGLLWELHNELVPHQQPYEEVFAMIIGHKAPAPADGFGAEYSGTLHVDQVVYAAREGFRCDHDWGGFVLHAYGNEPFWSAIVSDEEIRLKVLGRDDVVWPNTEVAGTGGGMKYTGRGNDDAPDIEIFLTPGPCRDSMSGAYFAYSSIVRTGSDEFEGCALPGFD